MEKYSIPDRGLATRTYNELKNLNIAKQPTQLKTGHGTKQRVRYKQEEPSLQQPGHSSHRASAVTSCYLYNPAAHMQTFPTLSMTTKQNHGQTAAIVKGVVQTFQMT